MAEAVFDGMERQLPCREGDRALAVLDMREAFFLGGRKHDAVVHEASGRIVVNGVDSKCVHSDPLSSPGPTGPGARRTTFTYNSPGARLLPAIALVVRDFLFH